MSFSEFAVLGTAGSPPLVLRPSRFAHHFTTEIEIFWRCSLDSPPRLAHIFFMDFERLFRCWSVTFRRGFVD
jgi:hypothetical protein